MDAIREMLAERVVELEAERDALTARLEDSQDWEEVALRFQAERNALAAHVERLREGLHQALIYRSGHCPDEEGAAYAECEKRCDDTPDASLAKLKAQWQAEALTAVIEDAPLAHADMLSWIDDRIHELHQQTQEPAPNGSD